MYEGLGLPVAAALERELERGVELLPDARAGAQRFAAGEGRHGA